jgi:hypothetical protein
VSSKTEIKEKLQEVGLSSQETTIILAFIELLVERRPEEEQAVVTLPSHERRTEERKTERVLSTKDLVSFFNLGTEISTWHRMVTDLRDEYQGEEHRAYKTLEDKLGYFMKNEASKESILYFLNHYGLLQDCVKILRGLRDNNYQRWDLLGMKLQNREAEMMQVLEILQAK